MVEIARTLTLKDCARILKAPNETSHKYSRGVLGLLTGSEAYPGAALMSARAAVNSGTGMVRFVGSQSLNLLMHLAVPEAVCTCDTESLERLQVNAWALGSGVAGAQREKVSREILLKNQPAVVDATAVALLAQLVAVDRVKFAAHHILSPHAGETADAFTWLMTLNPRLLPELTNIPSRQDIENDPAYFASLLAQTTGATVLLKGGGRSSLASPAGDVYSVRGNTPWLATAGSGDTLTGILGALLATYQAETRPEARRVKDYSLIAAAGVLIHGHAAELIPPQGIRGPVPPTLVAEHLPEAIAKILSRLSA